MYTLLAPVVGSQTILKPRWAAIMVFVVCISYWTLFYIAQEIDQPFGDDPNDLPIGQIQQEFNSKLSFFCQPMSCSVPEFTTDAMKHIHMLGSNFTLSLDLATGANAAAPVAPKGLELLGGPMEESQTVVLQPASSTVGWANPQPEGQTPARPSLKEVEEEREDSRPSWPTGYQDRGGGQAQSSKVRWVPCDDPLESAVLQELLPKVLPEDFAISDIRRILEAAGIGAEQKHKSTSQAPSNHHGNFNGNHVDSGALNGCTASLSALSLRVEDLLSEREGSITEPALRLKMYRLKEALTEILMDQCRV
jgi:hypothetical protein